MEKDLLKILAKELETLSEEVYWQEIHYKVLVTLYGNDFFIPSDALMARSHNARSHLMDLIVSLRSMSDPCGISEFEEIDMLLGELENCSQDELKQKSERIIKYALKDFKISAK